MAETPVSEFGARLKQARQARGISLAHIATVTKISVRALEAVERNDFSRLPGGIFTRAFVRAYAGEVGLDPEAALRQFLDQCPQEMAAVPTGSPESIDGTRREWQEKLSWRHAAVVLVVVGLIAAAVWLLLVRPEPDAAALPPPPAAGGAPAPRSPERVPADVAREPAVRAASASPPVAAAPASAPEAAVPLQLSLVFTAPCWTAVEADGARVAMRLFAAGERLDVAARRGISLKAGDAGAVALTVNGKAARPLGARGEVVMLRIDPDTWTSLLAR